MPSVLTNTVARRLRKLVFYLPDISVMDWITAWIELMNVEITVLPRSFVTTIKLVYHQGISTMVLKIASK